jgi:uncharacterized protein (TIGR03435 family)
MKIFLAAFLITSALSFCATSDTPSFEAASIRPAAPKPLPIPVEALPDAMRFQGGPGTNDPLRIRYTSVTLQQLLARAYGIELQQVSGPGWITGERYDIVATLPAGTDKGQLLLMLQGLLRDRFKVQMRRESKTVRVYELTVASGGPKLKPSEIVPEIRDPDEQRAHNESNARAALQANIASMQSGGPSNGFHIANGTMQELIRDLLRNVDRPIIDLTKLTGNFSFDLKWTPASMNSSGSNPDIFAALEEQLGLKLSPRNEILETIVVESAERSPEN